LMFATLMFTAGTFALGQNNSESSEPPLPDAHPETWFHQISAVETPRILRKASEYIPFL
jgi:hypothetical protein